MWAWSVTLTLWNEATSFEALSYPSLLSQPQQGAGWDTNQSPCEIQCVQSEGLATEPVLARQA